MRIAAITRTGGFVYMHPSEEHELVAETVIRRVYDRNGHVAGIHPVVLPGSLEEREVLALIDSQRWDELQPKLPPAERRRRLRKHWRNQRP
jgi:hypothetical protein